MTLADEAINWYDHQCPRPALAAARHQRLGRPGQRGDAATDPGRPGRARLALLDDPLAHPRCLAADPPSEAIRMWGGSATRAGRCGCTPARWRSSSGTTAGCPTISISCWRCPASGPTRLGRWRRSLTASGIRWWTRTCAGWSPGRSRASRRRSGHDRGRPGRDGGLLPADDARAARASIAFMELGAIVCTARSPKCVDCPFDHAARGGSPASPARPARAATRSATRAPTARSAACSWRCSGTPPARSPASVWTWCGRTRCNAPAPCRAWSTDGLVEPHGAEFTFTGDVPPAQLPP